MAFFYSLIKSVLTMTFNWDPCWCSLRSGVHDTNRREKCTVDVSFSFLTVLLLHWYGDRAVTSELFDYTIIQYTQQYTLQTKPSCISPLKLMNDFERPGCTVYQQLLGSVQQENGRLKISINAWCTASMDHYML